MKRASIGKRVLSLLLTLVLCVSLIQMSALAKEIAKGTDVTKQLSNFALAVTQEGKEITGETAIDTGKSMEVKSTFDLSLIDETGSRTVQTGDYAVIAFPDWLHFSGAQSVDMMAKVGKAEIKVGTVAFSENRATVTFDLTGIDQLEKDQGVTVSAINSAWFTASMDCTGSQKEDGGKNETFTILDKTFTYKLDHVVTYGIQKVGSLNDKADAINWTITADAKYSDGAASLSGAVVRDDLTAILGENTLKPEAVSVKDGAGESAKDLGEQAVVAVKDGVLTCTFQDAATASHAVISFATPFDKSAAYATGEATVANTAVLTKGDATVKSDAAVSYKPQWIEKKLAGQYSDAGCKKESADGLYYKWTIAVNQGSCDLKNAVIQEKLPQALQFVSASSDNGKTWKEMPENNVFQLGDINQKVVLTVVTKLAYAYGDHPTWKFTAGELENQASFRWDGSRTEGFTAKAQPDKGTGFYPITKSGTYDAATRTATWTVTVPKESLAYGDNLHIYDLIVEDSGFNKNSVSDTAYKDLASKLYPSASTMTLVKDSIQAGGLTVAPVALTDAKGRKATLLVATGFSANTAEDYTFTYQTKLTDPDVYAGNQKTVKNYATLMNDGDYIQRASAWISCGCMLYKDVLSRDQAQQLQNKSITLDTLGNIGRNNDGSAFNYTDHTAYFRILVNADGLNFNQETGKTFSFNDTLPNGWTFEKIDGADFLLYEGGATTPDQFKMKLEKQLSATEAKELVTKTTADSTMFFRFSQLDKPYVILVKAKMSDELFKQLYNENKAGSTCRNQVTSTSAAYKNQPGDYEDVNLIRPEVLTKELDGSKADSGELTWTVDYHTYGISRGQADDNTTNTTNTITDTLPEGIDLRTDSNGKLIYDKNITLSKLTMKEDGTYAVGDVITGDTLKNMVTYDLKSRVLTLALPKDGSDSYRLTYVTDVTGAEGAEINNTVSLNSATQTATDVKASYRISAAAAGAALTFGGRLTINKSGADGALSGATFELVNENHVTVRKAVSNTSGVAALKAIPAGSYTLKETAAPAGYALAADHAVTVSEDGKTVLVDGAAVNTLDITDVLTAAASLKISKQVTGSTAAADLSKSFTFGITLSGKENTEYLYTAVNGKGGNLKFKDGKASIQLTSGQSVTLWNLPVGETYTVAESDYSKDGYTTAVNGAAGMTATGKLAQGETAQAAFVNTKNTPYNPVNPSDPGKDIPNDPTPGSNIPSEPVTPVTPTVPGTEIPNPETPTTNLPDVKTPTANIPDSHVPQSEKAVTPKTGDEMLLWVALAASSAAGLSVLFLRRKRENGTRDI